MDIKHRLAHATWTCWDCGKKHGLNPNKPEVSTYHTGICDVCLKTDVPVTEPRNFGYFPGHEITPAEYIGDRI